MSPVALRTALLWCLWHGTLSFLPPTSKQCASSKISSFLLQDRNPATLQATTVNTFSGSIDELQKDEDRLDSMESLLQWAVDLGVTFNGTEFVADEKGDWGVILVEPKHQGDAILTVPSELILSTKDFQGTRLHEWMTKRLPDTYYLPECLLVLRLLEEMSIGEESTWQPWLKSLPHEFSTGLFLDSFERSHVARMAPKFLEQHEKQWQTCSWLITKVVQESDDISSPMFKDWLVSQPNLAKIVRWAFSIVLTRSWRTPDGLQAQLVPIGDMFNHDSRLANVRPSFRQNENGALQLCVTEDTDCSYDEPVGIYLSYGLCHVPERFLVNFGFCDTSSPVIDAHMDRYLQRNRLPPITDEKFWPPFDPSTLVVSTDNGVISEDLEFLVLLKILRERDPTQIPRIQKAYDTMDEAALNGFVESLFEKWDFHVTLELKEHFEDLLTNVFPEMAFNEREHVSHPRLAMIDNYNAFMRKTFTKTQKYLNLLLADQTSNAVVERK